MASKKRPIRRPSKVARAAAEAMVDNKEMTALWRVIDANARHLAALEQMIVVLAQMIGARVVATTLPTEMKGTGEGT